MEHQTLSCHDVTINIEQKNERFKCPIFQSIAILSVVRYPLAILCWKTHIIGKASIYLHFLRLALKDQSKKEFVLDLNPCPPAKLWGFPTTRENPALPTGSASTTAFSSGIAT
jgi:hypothetical protein